MGHKAHPIGLRLGIIKDWQSRWYADKEYPNLLQEDLKIRQIVANKYKGAGIATVEIERQAAAITITIRTARPGIVIGRGGQQVEELRRQLEKVVGTKVQVNIQEIRQPMLEAKLVADEIADQMVRRIPYRRVMKRSLLRTMDAGAKGIKIQCSGRLGGVEIARRVTMREGRVPLQTLRANIDYGFTEAQTAMGRIGVKIWIYKGDILPEPKELEIEKPPEVSATAEVEQVSKDPSNEQSVEVTTDVTTKED